MEVKLVYGKSKPMDQNLLVEVKVGYVWCGYNNIGPVLLYTHDTYMNLVETWKGFVKYSNDSGELGS